MINDNDFSEFIYEKVCAIIAERIMSTKNDIWNNQECTDINKNLIELFNLLEKSLPKDKIHLLTKLEEIYNHQELIFDNVMYNQGFIDGLNFNK
ncbi:hypothetical protein FDC58_15020 [Clostridium botulinum]|uniref:Uncharacterized protein n=1 Tax=Clostridium botulinum TaxID=1491 RepID=A0A0A0UXR0_CLOBO|nr:hypothetical protein [Clostridium botulinum]AIW54600.1 hypothetical protein [Clostridium botulinum]AIW54720.1 hypothetical protein [Clostridium botulinum]AIW54782.1 hypothetical protein [Clostridium botulinum]AIW54849.1 hypothetical protein [Clostridium botulinum]MBY7009279.1 hypothetical protein [Clostridium botulinum]